MELIFQTKHCPLNISATWYLIVSIYKLQYIWIFCQFLLQLLKLIFNVIKTGLISPPSLWGLIRTCRWKAGIGWAQSIAWANKRCKSLWLSSFWSEKSLLESNTSLWKFCWPDLTIKGLLLEKSWNFYVSVSCFKFTHGIILVIRRWEVSRHAGQWLTLVKLWNSCGQWTRGRITRKRMHRYETITVIN